MGVLVEGGGARGGVVALLGCSESQATWGLVICHVQLLSWFGIAALA